MAATELGTMITEEIVDVPPMPSYAHGEIIIALGAALYPHVRAHRLGHVYAAQTTYHIDGMPDRLPDLTFVAADKTPATFHRDGEVAPDLVVEIVSATDTYGTVSAKVQEYLDHGVRLVWVINPWLHTIDAYEAARQRLFALGDVLDAEPVIPGFTLPIRDLFDWEFNP
jgi:Uma2 family endonuclease